MIGFPWGGSEELWSQTALRLNQLGHSIQASVFRWPERPQVVTQLAASGVQIRYRARKPGFVVNLRQRLCGRNQAGALDVMEVLRIKRQVPDLVVLSQGGPWDGLPWMLECRRLGIAYCTVIHAHSEAWWPLDANLDKIRHAFEGAQRVYFVSQANRTLMERQCGMAFENGEVISNPMNLACEGNIPWPVEDKGIHFACVGRLDPSAKGQDILLDVLSQRKWKDRPVSLNLYGKGPCERSLRSLAIPLGEDRVRFHGQVSDLRGIWAHNHALVLPSRFEGLPLTIFEAMLCERPVITTAVAGNTELVQDDVTGFVAAAPTAPLLDDAMERAWSHRSTWPKMGRLGRERALKALPEDPVGTFAQKLLKLVEGKKSLA